MTQSPHSGQAAPVDTTIENADPSRPANVTSSDSTSPYAPPAPNRAPAWSPATTSNGAGDPRAAQAQAAQQPSAQSAAPRPDTPTDSVPIVMAETQGPAAGAPPAQASAPNGRAASGTGARRARARGPRRAQLQLRHINPWTVLKFSCVLAVALFFVWLIVVGVLYGILDATGVVSRINDAYTTLKGDGADAPVTAGVVFGSAAIIGVVNIILFIALSTIGSIVYNLCADLVGGVEVTLSER